VTWLTGEGCVETMFVCKPTGLSEMFINVELDTGLNDLSGH